MTSNIKISVINIDIYSDNEINYRIDLSYQGCSVWLEFYGYPDTFQEFGKKLSEFPQSIKDEPTFEIGKDEKLWAYYLNIKTFCYNASGHSAIKIKAICTGDIITQYKSEFCIIAEAASINRLGQLLRSWNPLQDEEINWTSNKF